MSWIDLLDDNRFLRTLFPEGDPSLASTRLHELQLHQDGPSVVLRFDLDAYPSQPPAKWQAAQSNTVQVRLVGVGIPELEIRAWSRNNVGRLRIERREPGIEIAFSADGCHVAAVVDHLRVDSVTAYRNQPQGT